MKDKEISPEKFKAIFTKYVAFGQINDVEELKTRITGKIISQFEEEFCKQIHFLDSTGGTGGEGDKKIVEMQGSEILFRGMDSESGLTEDVIKQQFLIPHVGMYKIYGVSEQNGSYIIRNRRELILDSGRRISYATATMSNFAAAAKYAKGHAEGWIYDIRPKKGKIGVLTNKKYQEIDFSSIDPEEIYAVYKVSQINNNESTAIEKITETTSTITEIILNPHYKKRKSGDSNLFEGELFKKDSVIKTAETNNRLSGISYSIASAKDDSNKDLTSFLNTNEKQQEIYNQLAASGNNTNPNSGITTQFDPPEWLTGNDYKESFDNTKQSPQGLKLWDQYKEDNSSQDDWFFAGSRNFYEENKFKVFIPVEAEDLLKAAEILIKNGYFQYDKLPLCEQKLPLYRSVINETDTDKRLAIILYAQGKKVTKVIRSGKKD